MLKLPLSNWKKTIENRNKYPDFHFLILKTLVGILNFILSISLHSDQ